MFVPRYFFEKFVALLETQHAISFRQTEDGLQRVLAAKDAEVRAVIAAKDQQVNFLTAALATAEKQISHERQRAEAAIDILLTKNGEAGPVRNADLIRQVAEREAAGGDHGVPRPADRGVADALKAVFSQVNDVLGGEEDGLGNAPDEVVSIAGGTMPS